MLACAKTKGKIPYYYGINIKSAIGLNQFTNKVIYIKSWSYTLQPIGITSMCCYEQCIGNSCWSGGVCHPQNHEYQYIVFHGAKNTKYGFYIDVNNDSCHGSLGIPSDYRYFIGITLSDPYYSINNFYYSTYFNSYYSDMKDLSMKEFTFTTDSNGDFIFRVDNCPARGHLAHFIMNIYVYGYHSKSLTFDYLLPRIF